MDKSTLIDISNIFHFFIFLLLYVDNESFLSIFVVDDFSCKVFILFLSDSIFSIFSWLEILEFGLDIFDILLGFFSDF